MSDRTTFLAIPSSAEGAPGDLGAPEAELRAAREGVAVGWHERRGLFEVSGADRHDFLHRMLTATIEPGDPGSGLRTLLLDNKGHVLADIDLFEEEGRVLGVTGADAVETALAALGRYVLRSDVRLEPVAHHVIAAVGPESESLLQELGISAPASTPGSSRGRVGEAEVRCLRTPRLAGGFELTARPEESGGVAAALLDAGGTAVGSAALETLRVEAGIPGHGSELTGDEFPQEAHLDPWVDFDKGCYLGQETVARIHYRGQVNRLLCRLRSEESVETGRTLVRERREVGVITSVAPRAHGGPMALAYVRRELAEAGTHLACEPGAVAMEVLETIPQQRTP